MREKLASIVSKMPVGTPPKGGRKKGSPNVNTAKKAKIAQHFASLGGQKLRGAAAQTARKFGIFGEGGASRVLRIAKQVAEGKIEPKPHPGRRSAFDEAVKEAIIEAFSENDTSTYREVANELGLSLKTLHRYATRNLDYRTLKQGTRPATSDAQKEKRVAMSHDILAVGANPVTDEFHQDEKPFTGMTKRLRKIRNSRL